MHVARPASTVGALLTSLLACLLMAAAPAPAASAAARPTSCLDAAHRGTSSKATENSMRSFKAAVREKADYLEMDVQVTSDGRFVLMHDETVNRTTNGRGRIIDKTWAQLSDVRLDDGQPLPTLSRVLDMAEPTTSNVLLELKWVPSSRFAKFKRLIDGFGADRVVVDSFSPYVVKRFHETYPDVATALDVNKQISVAAAKTYGGVMPDWRHVSDRWLSSLRDAGVPTYLWTVDTAAGWKRFSGKVTLLLTNRPAEYDAWRATHCR